MHSIAYYTIVYDSTNAINTNNTNSININAINNNNHNANANASTPCCGFRYVFLCGLWMVTINPIWEADWETSMCNEYHV